MLSQTQRRETHFLGEIPVPGKELLVPGVRSLCGFSLPLGISNGGWAGEERRPTNPEVGVGVGEKDLPSQPLQLPQWPLGFSCRALGRAEVGRARSPLPVGPQDCTHCLLLQRTGLWFLRAPSPLELTEQQPRALLKQPEGRGKLTSLPCPAA